MPFHKIARFDLKAGSRGEGEPVDFFVLVGFATAPAELAAVEVSFFRDYATAIGFLAQDIQVADLAAAAVYRVQLSGEKDDFSALELIESWGNLPEIWRAPDATLLDVLLPPPL